MDTISGRRCARTWWWSLLVVGSIVIGCASGNKEEEKSITCYQCNSEYDPRCGDPFDPYTLGTVNCSMKKPLEHLPDNKPVLCRKTVQKVQGHLRVVRGCGWVTDERDDGICMKRSGTHDVQIHYCSCTKNLCNGAHRPQASPPHAWMSVFGTTALVATLMSLLQRLP